jgi:hypothetical protein
MNIIIAKGLNIETFARNVNTSSEAFSWALQVALSETITTAILTGNYPEQNSATVKYLHKTGANLKGTAYYAWRADTNPTALNLSGSVCVKKSGLISASKKTKVICV